MWIGRPYYLHCLKNPCEDQESWYDVVAFEGASVYFNCGECGTDNHKPVFTLPKDKLPNSKVETKYENKIVHLY